MKEKFETADANKFRDICIRRIEEIDPQKDAALALSGGTDSMTALFAMIETGRKPECYTFYMTGYPSKDLKSSRFACKYFGLNLHEIAVPSDVDGIYADIQRVLPYCEYPKKTIVQCMIPWLYIYPAMSEKLIINGIGGDDFYGTQRKVNVEYAKSGDKGIIQYRRFYGHYLEYSEGNILRLAGTYGKVNIGFYDSKEMEDFLLEFSFRAINKPFAKYPSVLAWTDYYKKAGFYRDQIDHSYQINSKLRDYHDRLLTSKYNVAGNKSVVGIYNRVWKEMKEHEGLHNAD